MSKQGYKCSPQIVERPLGVCELRYGIECMITHILAFLAISSIVARGLDMRHGSQLDGLKCIPSVAGVITLRQPGPRWEHTPAFFKPRSIDTESLAFRNQGRWVSFELCNHLTGVSSMKEQRSVLIDSSI